MKKQSGSFVIGALFSVIGGYLPLPYLFLLHMRKLSIDREVLIGTTLLTSLLATSYALTENNNILRMAALVPLNMLVKRLLELHFNQGKDAINLVDRLFIFHSLIITACIFFPEFNLMLVPTEDSITRIDVSSRIGGLIGFDFVAFFYGTYLLAEYRCKRGSVNTFYLFKLAISTMFVILAGRYGVGTMLFLLAYIILDNFGPKKFFLIIAIMLIALAGIILFQERIQFIVDSMFGVVSFSTTGDTGAFDSISGEATKGFYAASPLTWYYELSLPFEDVFKYLTPSATPYSIDSGPSYLFMNIGFLLGVISYMYLLTFFRIGLTIWWPLVVVFLICDLKFRGAFVPSVMFWVYLNIIKIGKVESEHKIPPNTADDVRTGFLYQP